MRKICLRHFVPLVLCTRGAAPVEVDPGFFTPDVVDVPLPGPGRVEERAKVDVPSTISSGESVSSVPVGRAIGTEKTWPLTEIVEPPGVIVCEAIMKFPELGS